MADAQDEDLCMRPVLPPSASPKHEAAHASAATNQAPSASAKSTPEQAKGEKESPATNLKKLTAEHLPIGAVVQTKSGKTGVITHVHKKAGYLFIHNAGLGKTYHVSMASITNVSGESAADILAKQGKGDGLGEDVKAAAEKMVAKQGGSENYWQSRAGKAILEAQSKPKGDVSGNPKQAPAWEALQSQSSQSPESRPRVSLSLSGYTSPGHGERRTGGS